MICAACRFGRLSFWSGDRLIGAKNGLFGAQKGLFGVEKKTRFRV